MRLLDALRWARSGIRAGRAATQAVEKSGAQSLADVLFRLGYSPEPPGNALTNPFGQHPTAYRAIAAFARNVAAMPFELYRKGTDDVVEDGPVRRLLDRPNSLMRGTQLFEALTIDLEASGNGLWWYGQVARASASGQRLPVTIRRLDPNRTKVLLGAADIPEFYQFNAKAGPIKIPAAEVSHFKYWNPADESWGQSWTGPAAGEIELDYNAGRWNRGFFRRGAEPGFLLVPQEGASVSPESAERFRQSWIARHAGVERAHSPAILPGTLKPERTGIGQKEMEFNEGRRFSRENVLSTAGVPPAIAGILEYANYANMMPQLRIFFHLELLPRLAYIEDVIQADLLDRFGTGLEGYFKTETIMALADEIEAKTEAAVRLHSIGTPLTIINDRLGMGLDLDGVDGADEPYSGDAKPATVPGLPGLDGKDDEEQPRRPTDREDDDEDDEEERSVRPPRHLRRNDLDAIWRGLVNRVHDLELQAEARWRSHLRNLRDETLRNIPAVKAAPRLVVKVTDETAKSGELFNLDDANDEAIVSMEPVWRQSMARGVDTVGQQLGIEIDFHFTDPRVQKLLANRRQDIRAVNERMLTELHELLGEGLAQQESEEDLRRRVVDYFGGERANARTVARTETFSAYSSGRFEAMQEADVSRHRWVTARDARVRDSHAALEGESVLIGSPFSNGLNYPLDPGGNPGDVINCRCVTVPEVA